MKLFVFLPQNYPTHHPENKYKKNEKYKRLIFILPCK